MVIIAVLVPSLLVGGWLAGRSAASERAQTETGLRQKVQEIANVLDHKISGLMSVLAALSSSQFLHAGDLSEFRRQASEVSKQLGVQIVLLNSKFDQLANTAVPWGAPLPTSAMISKDAYSDILEPLRSGKTVVSNVIFGPISKRYVVVVAAPVMIDGRAAFFLGIVVPTDDFAELMVQAQLAEQSIGIIIDRNDVVVVRSERNVFLGSGTKTGGALVAGPEDKSGVIDRVNREGIAFHSVWLRSDSTGWLVAVGVPERILNAPSMLALASYSAAGALFLCAGLAFTYRFGGRLTEEIGQLETAANLEREQTRKQFAVLVESTPNGVIGIDQAGMIAAVNSQTKKMFGYDRDELIGKPVERLIPERFRDVHRALRTAYSVAPEPRAMGAGRDLFGLKKDGSEFPVEISLSVLRNGASILLLASVVDISERKRAEAKIADALAALRTSEQRRRYAAEAGGIGPWNWDFVKNERWWSEEYRRVLGVAADVSPSRELFRSRVYPPDRKRLEEDFNHFRAQGGVFNSEFRASQSEMHSIRWISTRGRIDRDANGRAVMAYGVIQDITARKAAERQRDELRLRLVQIQEQERLRLAQELHDETGEMLTAALLELERIETFVGTDAQAKLQSLREQLGQIGGKLHRIAWDLGPASINELGLETAISNYVSKWRSGTGIDASFFCSDGRLDELADTARTTLYRVVQEALTNVAKHAPTATGVSVTINRTDSELRLNIEDDGPGIALADVTEEQEGQQKLGIAGMRERLTLIGGRLEIESSLGVGTALYVRIPVQRAETTA